MLKHVTKKITSYRQVSDKMNDSFQVTMSYHESPAQQENN